MIALVGHVLDRANAGAYIERYPHTVFEIEWDLDREDEDVPDLASFAAWAVQDDCRQLIVESFVRWEGKAGGGELQDSAGEGTSRQEKVHRKRLSREQIGTLVMKAFPGEVEAPYLSGRVGRHCRHDYLVNK